MCKLDIRKRVCKYLKRLKRSDDCFDEFYNAVYFYVQGIVYNNLFDKSYVDDAVLNAFCKIRANIGMFDETKNGFAWICKIAQNEARRINAAQSARTLSIDEIACVDELRAPPSDRELVCDVKAAIDKLDQPFKRIVVCRIYYCMTYKEIADKLGLRLTTVYYNYKKALKFLRTFLTDC